ncbi:dipeptidyl peptidase IV N-terminal region-domain-containing protein [Microdochium trichocladiopsis]|uniref:Probable dipeptidyl-aminopeptidase B n=1 Tax=Microdochium trichocladiopsis TaxID=1682393 RepID=A0A9P8Y2E7_9PEZI|nr:dipeptidyl peptidase IV N-terminal region-domain-containing protein [Microdochium trichocladiopsis]KAH7027962.1 dipeptidyl peptidase IV N-terminal region-domain-containing protein [Microdochium trichocladiopsis]
MRSTETLTALAVLLQAVAAIEPPRQPRQPLGGGDKIISWNDTMVNRLFRASSTSVSWLSGGQDGEYIFQAADGALILENFITSENETFVAADLIPEDLYDYSIRSDLQKVLFATNYTKQYRHSYFADYSVLDVASGEVEALVDDQVGDIQYAEFAPAGDAIAFVRGNNLFLKKNGTISQITEDGSPDLFHGVPDWVYEEEIFGTRSTLWFSPDGQSLAFLSFNETGVETFTIPYYMDNQQIAPVYPKELELRYPKVGTTNPTVSLTVLDVVTEDKTPVIIDVYEPDNLVIGEVAWVTEDHSSLIYLAYNRVQDQSTHVRVDIGSDGKVLTETVRNRDGTDGWLDNSLAIQYVGEIDGKAYYLDLSDESGWMHIYLYPLDGSEPTALTEGEWEVTSVLKIDLAQKLVYYVSTQADSTERHVFSVSWENKKITPLVDVDVPAAWSASFSSGGGYYILSYQGPDVPYQELYATNDTSTPLRTITSNEALWTRLQDYNLPNITYLTLEHPDGYSMNVMQRLPPNFDPAKKYPALLTPYGGPGSQEVNKAYQTPSWDAYISSDPELEYIQYTVDNRGTGYKGRAFRSLVASHLGDFEAEDQIWAAAELAKRHEYVDADHFGIFGWSYGGYLAAKVVEADSGVISLGLIVAPVSDWRFYDSMYTERYMKTTQDNEEGYNGTAVRKTDGFKNIAGKAAIMHGTGDDNVHYQNAAALIDLLVGSGVTAETVDWRSFTDSDHSINYHGATNYLYKYMTSLLYEERLRTKEDALKHQWSKKSEGQHQWGEVKL